ncbi:MAG: hypothetical protein NT019_02540 [Candidatus Adlerbacteria bacterium]|nr:hypothetical protein [Candidatus Adlerbacteria bacterium]
MISASDFKISIENQKGSYKSFGIENDPVWSSYPLQGVTYPVDYGYIQGYTGEDGAELDVFVGTGNLQGCIRVWRLDVPVETKFFIETSESELKEIKKAFLPVLRDVEILDDEGFNAHVETFKSVTAD